MKAIFISFLIVISTACFGQKTRPTVSNTSDNKISCVLYWESTDTELVEEEFPATKCWFVGGNFDTVPKKKDSVIRTDSVKCFIQYFVEVRPGIVLTKHSPCVAIYDITTGHIEPPSSGGFQPLIYLVGEIKTLKKILINGQEFDLTKRYSLIRQDEVVK